MINISVGASRRETHWKTESLTWEAFVKRLSTPTRTQESCLEYASMSKVKRDMLKDVGGFVGGTLRDGKRKAESVVSRSLITLDLDNVPGSFDPWPVIMMFYDNAAAMYSTHSHTQENQRYRLIMPLSRDVSPDEYSAIARMVASDIGIDFCDDTTFEPSRLMYWPSCSRDAVYRFESVNGEALDPDFILARYDDWKDVSQWPRSSRQAGILKRTAGRKGDPVDKDGAVGAFCRCYSIDEAIETFLSDLYVKADEDRYTYTKGSTSGGMIVYDNGKFAYSHHSTDPAAGKLNNAFDLVRIHKFGYLDEDEDPETRLDRLPSHKAMCEFAVKDEKVKMELVSRYFNEEDAEEEDREWVSELEVSKAGAILPTTANLLLIMEHDDKLKGKICADLFYEQIRVFGDLPWQKLSERKSPVWSDADDAGLRWYLEQKYKLDARLKVMDALELIAQSNPRHSVREYLEGLEWDGTERVDTLFIDLLNAPNTSYVKTVTRKSLIGAVARIYQPGCKHDNMLVLVGPQGCGKSLILSRLGGTWFSDSLFTVTGKDAYEQLQGAWIIEMGEMAAAKKAEIEALKQFISKQVDSFRAAYARRAQSHPRQCVFFGTTNDTLFLKDYTGSRRFWPVTVSFSELDLNKELSQGFVDQVWAEAVVRYKRHESHTLTQAESREAEKVQEAHTEVSDLYGLIAKYIDTPVPVNWDEMSLFDRKIYLQGEQPAEDSDVLMLRPYICAIAVWCELLGGELKTYSSKVAREINACLKKLEGWEPVSSLPDDAIYGRQRGFRRGPAPSVLHQIKLMQNLQSEG